MVDDPEGRASDFDDKIPADKTELDEIDAHLRKHYGHVLPDAFIDQVAPHIRDIRETEEKEGGSAAGSDGYLDTDTGRYRDPDTGHFIEGPDDG